MRNSLDSMIARLRIKQLQLLIALDDLKSLHRASNALAMTQSAASKALAELEGILGVSLFERRRSGLVANEYGRTVLRYARVVTASLGSLHNEIDLIQSGQGGSLVVGAIMGSIPGLAAPIASRLHAANPSLAINIVEDTSLRMLELLDQGEVDLVIGRVSVSENPDRYAFHAICDEPLSVVVSNSCEESLENLTSLGDLDGYTWITYPSHMPLHDLLQRELDLAGLPPVLSPLSSASTFVCLSLLQQHPKAVAILPTAVATFFAESRLLRIVPIQLRSPSQSIGVITRASGALSAAAQAFVDLALDSRVGSRRSH
jgi:DNA-binding transcriptional LysR family regulator